MNGLLFDIGLDVGGTTTRAQAQSVDQTVRTSSRGPGANPAREGLEGAADILAGILRDLLLAYPDAAIRSVCAGVAGAGEVTDQETLAAGICRRLGTSAPHSFQVVHDARIALEGAFEGGSGMIIIAGTGSSLMARTPDDVILRAGGWGFLVGDEGSGHALGARGLNAVAGAFDGGPSTLLSSLAAEYFGMATPEILKHRVYLEHWPLQEMAPLVIEAAAAGDAVSASILSDQTGALALQASWLARRAPDLTPRIALLGGLTDAPVYRAALSAALLHELPEWHILAPLHAAVEGALLMARAAGDGFLRDVTGSDGTR